MKRGMYFMNEYLTNRENTDIFSKCFIELKNLSDDFNNNFMCTVWNQPRQGMLNIRECWQFSFYAQTPILALEKGVKFVQENYKNGFNLKYDECSKLAQLIINKGGECSEE
jgi:hypothetical protein